MALALSALRSSLVRVCSGAIGCRASNAVRSAPAPPSSAAIRSAKARTSAFLVRFSAIRAAVSSSSMAASSTAAICASVIVRAGVAAPVGFGTAVGVPAAPFGAVSTPAGTDSGSLGMPSEVASSVRGAMSALVTRAWLAGICGCVSFAAVGAHPALPMNAANATVTHDIPRALMTALPFCLSNADEVQAPCPSGSAKMRGHGVRTAWRDAPIRTETPRRGSAPLARVVRRARPTDPGCARSALGRIECRRRCGRGRHLTATMSSSSIRNRGNASGAVATWSSHAGPVPTVSIMEFRDGKVAHETQYFADPFEAPAWRAPWRGTTR